MATRSKNNDKFAAKKAFCFLLAVLLAGFGCAFTLLQAAIFEENETNAGAFVSDVLRGVQPKGTDVPKMTAFQNENATLQSLAVQRYLYGDGSKKAYEAYQKNQKAASSVQTDAIRETMLQNCAGESGNGSPASIFAYLPDSLIYLRKLDAHDKHWISSDDELIVDEVGVYLENDFDRTDVYAYGDEDFYGVDGDPTGQYTTLLDAVTNPQSVYGSDYEYQSSHAIPKAIKEQLRDGEIAVELCRTRYENGGNTYDGYYALSVNEAQLKAHYGKRETNYNVAFSSFAEFQNAYANMRQLANAYKNLTFAVVDNKTGVAASNISDLDGKKLTKDDLRVFTKATWNYKLDLLSGNRTLSDAAQRTENGGVPYWNHVNTGELNATLYVAFDQTLSKADVFSHYPTRLSAARTRILYILLADVLCLLGILFCAVYLVLRAGRKAGDDAMYMRRGDRIFTLLRTCLNLGAAVGLGGIAFAVWEALCDEGMVAAVLMSVAVGLCAAGIMALVLDWVLFLARHIKNGTLLQNLFAVWLYRKTADFVRRKKAALAAKPPVYRDILNDVLRRALLMAVLPNVTVGIVAILFASGDAWGIAFCLLLLLFGYDCFLIYYICRYAYHLRTVIAAVQQVRAGDLHVQIETAKMPAAVKAFADDVAALQEGLQVAVAQALKEERTKTELITNVSHDLKTPLTSIINYVDLLSRCDIDDPTAQSYIAVLGEKSDRLKKLIEDLVEASKASAGAVKVELTQVSLNELAAQLLGEYADDFAVRRLTAITGEQDDAIYVRADSKLSYRVLDNLMGNVKKYAMPGTRVYVTLETAGDRGVFTLQNISEQPLNISVEELRARFVRGDASRSTEGSGLGLSIAEDLCSLQGAELSLSVAGDLFTASVSFPLTFLSAKEK